MTSTTTTAATIATVPNPRRELTSQVTACRNSRLTAINWRTSTVTNASHCSSPPRDNSANEPPGRCIAYPNTSSAR